MLFLYASASPCWDASSSSHSTHCEYSRPRYSKCGLGARITSIPRNLLAMRRLGTTPDLLNQNLRVIKISGDFLYALQLGDTLKIVPGPWSPGLVLASWEYRLSWTERRYSQTPKTIDPHFSSHSCSYACNSPPWTRLLEKLAWKQKEF